MADSETQALEPTHPTVVARINDVLPLEVISEIFSLSVPSYDICLSLGDHSPTYTDQVITLASVCRSWKEIIWSTPSVWCFVVFNLYGANEINNEIPVSMNLRLEQLSRWISRSGDLPLSISIVDYSSRIPASSVVMEHLFSTLSSYSLRLEHLNCRIGGPGLFGFSKLAAKAINLRSFSFKVFNSIGCDFETEYFQLQRHRKLTNISLNQISIRWFTTNWELVTHLRLRHFYVDECLKALSTCHNLVHLNLRFMCSGDDDLGLPSAPIFLPSLRYIDWFWGIRSFSEVDLGTFLSKLNTPALRVMRWLSNSEEYSPFVIGKFINSCSASLEVFIVGYSFGWPVRDWEGNLFTLWTQSPHLTIVDIVPNDIPEERSEVPYLSDDMLYMYDNVRGKRWGSVSYLLPALKVRRSEMVSV